MQSRTLLGTQLMRLIYDAYQDDPVSLQLVWLLSDATLFAVSVVQAVNIDIQQRDECRTMLCTVACPPMLQYSMFQLT